MRVVDREVIFARLGHFCRIYGASSVGYSHFSLMEARH